MKLLFDQGTPAPLRKAITSHEVKTARQAGWDQLQNGALLAAAEPAFDAFITTDKNLKYQQNLESRKLAILVLPTTSWPRIQEHLSLVLKAIDSLKPGDFVELQFPA